MTMQVGLVLFGSLVVMLLLDFPIALALGLSSVVTIGLFSLVPFDVLAQLLFATADSFTLLAIPFFIFAGMVLGHTSISKRLIDLASSMVGSVPGGLGVVGIVAAVFFAGISGSGPADVAALGLILIPAMATAGYSKGFATALTAASGGIGIIVPPSIALIIYGFIAEVSISELFLAGIVPGIVVALSLILVTMAISYKHGYRPVKKERLPLLIAFRRAFWGLLAPVIILGGIYGGIFTPTEAAAVAVIYSLAVDLFVYRSLRPSEIVRISAQAGVASAAIMSILVTAALFAWILNTQGVAAQVASALLSVTQSRWVLLLGINAILICAGMFLDAISIFYIFLPVLLPVTTAIGMDPVHFGIVMTVNLAIGQITPPVGINLVTASGISGLDIGIISRAALPFIAAECMALMIITYIPALSLSLPALLSGNP